MGLCFLQMNGPKSLFLFGYRGGVWLLLVLGGVHTVLTPLFFHQLNEASLWFAGSGLALLFCALLNLVVLHTPTRPGFRVVLLANTLGSVFGGLVLIVLAQPQAALALLAFLLCLLGSWRSLRSL